MAELAGIQQIRDREYYEKLRKGGVENILLAGISYDTARKSINAGLKQLIIRSNIY